MQKEDKSSDQEVSNELKGGESDLEAELFSTVSKKSAERKNTMLEEDKCRDEEAPVEPKGSGSESGNDNGSEKEKNSNESVYDCNESKDEN